MRVSVGDLVDGAVEHGLVRLRRLREAAHLADVLLGCGADLVVGRGRLEVVERLDVPAHAVNATASGPAGGVGRERRELAPQLLDLVAELGRVLEAELLGGGEHLLLERDHELLELVSRHALDLGLAAATAARNRRRLEREELGDVGDALDDRLGGDPVLLVVRELRRSRRRFVSSSAPWIASVSLSA